jgi:hypothetical protein
MIEGRATGTCSLGPLIRADVAASDSLPGTGLIKWRGSCELLGVFSPQMGAAVTFSYTIQGKATQTIPKKFRVLSSFADPLANNGRGQTTVELGCLLTYMEDAAEPTELKSRDDDELGNESQSDEDFDAIGASVSARFAFKQCANAIGVSFNFRDGALESTFRVDTIDLKVGYISVMSDLLVSESMVGELDANEVLQIRRLTEASGEAGKLLNTSNILSIAPLNAGELPGENVAVEYSSWRLKEPDSDEGLNSPWEKTIQIGPTYKYMVGTTIVTFGGAFSIGFIVPVYVDMMPVKTNTTTYMDLVVDGTTRSFVKEDETVIVTAVKKQWNNDFTDPTAGEYVWPNGEDDSFALFATDTIRTVYEYDEKGRVVLQETFTIDSGWTYQQKLGPEVAGTGDLPVLMTPQNTKRSVLTGYEKIETTYSENKRRTDSLRLIHKKLSQAGQWQTVWYINNFRLEFGDKPETYKEDSELEGLVYQDAQVNYTITPSELENAAPTKTERLSVGSQDDPLERSTETVWVYGDQQSIRRRVFRMPFAPDDLVTGTSGNYSVTPSNAEAVARLFGRVQNKLLFGARYGVQLQLLPVQVPAMAFDALNVDLAGVMGQFRLNNLSYVIEPGEVVCGCNALYWGTIGSTPYSGTASGSWVPLPASSSGYTAPQDVNTVEAGTTFVISSVGTTSQEDWNTLAGTSGVTYSEGDTITAVVDGSTLDSSTGTVSTLQPAPTPTSDPTLGEVVTTDPEDVQPPYTTTERYALAAYRGRFVLSGTETATRLALRFGLAADSRAFVLSGRPVTLRKSIQYQLAANAAAFVITGNDADVVHGYNLGPVAGAYVMTGQDAALATTGAASFELLGVTGSFALTGNEAELNPTILTPLPGSFGLSGNDVDLSLFAVEPFNGFGAKYTNPATLPTNDANGVAFSPSGEAIAVAFRSSPFIAAYPWDAATGFGTKYSNPATAVPGFSGQAVAFSPAGDAIAIAIDDETCVAVYAWDDATGFGAKYSDPSTAIVGDYGWDVAFSPSGNAIAVSHGFTQPSVSAYAWDASTGFGTKYSNPASTPEFAFDSENVAFTPAGDAIAVTFDDTPGIVVYSWDDATGFGVQYSDPATEAPIGSDDLAFSPAGDAIASTDIFEPGVYVCSWDSATGFGAKYTDPSTALTSSGRAVAFSPLSDAILIGYFGAPYISAYAWDSTTGFGAKFSDPATAPTGRVSDIAFSPTGDAVAIAHNTSPRITVYANADPS